MDLPYTLERTRPPQIAVIVLSSDETLEPDFHRLLPAPIELLISRVPAADHVGVESLAAMDGQLAEAASRFPSGAKFLSAGYGCTSATAQIGADKVHRQIAEGLGAPDLPISEPLTACLAACSALKISRLAVLNPYVPDVSARLVAAFTDGGLSVTRVGSFNVSEEARVVRISAQSLYRAAVGIAREPGSEGLFLSCTNLRTLDVIDRIEAEIGKPVLSSNQVLAWDLARRAGLAEMARIPGALGQL